MFRPLFCRSAPFPLVLDCSRPLVGVDAESSEIVQETLHPFFFLPPPPARTILLLLIVTLSVLFILYYSATININSDSVSIIYPLFGLATNALNVRNNNNNYTALINIINSDPVVVVVASTLKSRSDLYSVLSNIRTGPTDANSFRGHRLTTQKGYT